MAKSERQRKEKINNLDKIRLKRHKNLKLYDVGLDLESKKKLYIKYIVVMIIRTVIWHEDNSNVLVCNFIILVIIQ